MTFLEIKNLAKSFGGNKVLTGTSFEVEEGKINALIGPNGAGKTTLFNIVSGLLKADSGKIKFKGRDITNLPPHKVCKAGIGRTFQIANPIKNMSVIENVLTACMYGKEESNGGDQSYREEALEILNFVGLSEKKEKDVETLEVVNIKRLEIARSIGCNPELILLDEPLAGLNPSELKMANKLIERVRDELGMSILIVEHIMETIMKISEIVNVLHEGNIICQGPPKKVSSDEEVLEAYLGEEES